MLLTHFLVVKSIIGIVTSLLINDLHPREMLLGTQPENVRCCRTAASLTGDEQSRGDGSRGDGRRTRGNPDGHGVIQADTGASRRTRGHPDGLGGIQTDSGTKKTSRETRVFRDV